MVRLMQQSLASKFPDKFIFVEFNAWLYQGYDDVKAALMEVIAKVLLEHSEKTRKGTENVKEFSTELIGSGPSVLLDQLQPQLPDFHLSA